MHDSKVLVLVTNQYSCQRLITAGVKIAKEKVAAVAVMSIQPTNLFGNIAEEMEFLFQKSRENNAEMTVFFNDDPVSSVENYIKSLNVSDIVLGISEDEDSQFVNKVFEFSEEKNIYVVDREGRYLNFAATIQNKVS